MDLWKLIVGQNWSYYSHQKLYDMVRTEARGAAAVEPIDEAWARFTELMRESQEDIRDALASVGASWEGLAEEAMATGVSPLAQWAEDAGTAGTASGNGVRHIGSSFAFTSNAMPEPVPVTSTANTDAWGIPAAFTHLLGGQTDQDRQEREAQQAKLRAVELMNGYAKNSHTVVTNLGRFVPPQGVTVGTASQGITPLQHASRSFTVTPGPTVSTVDGGPRDPSYAAPPAVDARPATRPASNTPLPSTTTVSGLEPAAGYSVGGGSVSHDGSHPAPGGRPLADHAAGPLAGAPLGVRSPGGGSPGSIPPDRDRVTRPVGIRGTAGGPGFGPLGTGSIVDQDEDHVHESPGYLRSYHDEFWDGSMPAAPPVLGVDTVTPGEG